MPINTTNKKRYHCKIHNLEALGRDGNPFNPMGDSIYYICPACEYIERIDYYKKNSPTGKYLPIMEQKLKELIEEE